MGKFLRAGQYLVFQENIFAERVTVNTSGDITEQDFLHQICAIQCAYIQSQGIINPLKDCLFGQCSVLSRRHFQDHSNLEVFLLPCSVK